MRKYLLSLLLLVPGLLPANMAYWGPEPGNVAGRNTTGKLRVKHETITVDMRGLPDGKIRVFADYRLESNEEAGEMIFLFVASGKNPVNPEIILDGKVLRIERVMEPYLHNSRGSVLNIPKDSWPESIGRELEGPDYFHQPIEDSLWTFRLFITPGIHRLKIGYELSPTAYVVGDLTYYSFAYYLGNKFTRPLYDQIDMKVLFPEDLAWKSNFKCTEKNGELHAANLQTFKKGHLLVSFYKNVQAEINQGRVWLQFAHWGLWLITGLLTIFFVRKRLRSGKKLRWGYLLGIPICLVLGIAYASFTNTFFGHFIAKYNLWISGWFGKGYQFLAMPVVAMVALPIWLGLVFAYQFWYHRKKKKIPS